jgi:hypothetical protein
MGAPGILEGLSEDVDTSALWQFSAITDDVKAKAFEAKFGIPLVVKFRHVPESFARMIAKIGYRQVLTTLAPNDFESICAPYILGTKNNLSHIVGCSAAAPTPDDGLGYVLRTTAIGNADGLLMMAEVRLYASAFTPIYQVVVGRVTGREAVAIALRKMSAQR